SASSAFETFQAQTFPLVVVSSRLPDLEGVAFMHKLRALPRGDEACVLVTHSGLVSDTALIEAGADDIIDTVRGPELLRTRFALARNRVRRGARSNAEDLVRVFERALRESEVRYRALFDQSPVGVFLCDRNLRINDVNERLRQITGRPRGQMLGVSLVD